MKTCFFTTFFLLGIFFTTNAQVQADFEADTLKGCDILAGVEFTDLSTGNITQWDWDFGNGNVSSIQNPITNFTQAGVFDVQLIVSDGVNSDTLIKSAYIELFDGPTSNYTVDTTNGCPPLDVRFLSSSTQGDSPITEWIWDYGDGSPTVNNADNIHTYTSQGNFPTSLIVVDSEGCKNSKNGSTISIQAGPVTNFTSNGIASTCQLPLVVNFINLTSNHAANVTYKWDFGDGTFSTQRNPTKTYTALGAYDVKLVASNGLCSDSITIAGFAEIGETNASFSLAKKELCYKVKEYEQPDMTILRDTITDTLKITNLSTGGDEFEWDFGDGNTSTEENPIHFYADTGRYDVKLTVSSGVNCLDDTIISIYVQSVHASFTTPTPAHSCVVPVSFDYTGVVTSKNAVSWSWHFQTDSTATIENVKDPIFVQTVNGLYNDTLIVTSAYGCKDTVFTDQGSRDTRFPGIEIVADTVLSGCSPWSLNFESNPVSGMGSPPAAFPLDWAWDFGNGEMSTDTFPDTQTYVKDTIYEVKLVITDSSGCKVPVQTKVRVGYLTNPIIKIEDDSLCINDVLEVQEISGNRKIKKWEWVFYDDTTRRDLGPSRMLQKTVEEIAIEIGRDTIIGTYGLEVVTSYNECYDTTRILATDVPPGFVILGPTAKPAFQIDSCGGYKVNFFTKAIDADTYLWEFGDGVTSDSINPTHTFSANGSYKQKYTIGNSVTGCEVVDSFNLGVAPIQKGIVAVDTAGCAPFMVDMTGADNRFVGYTWYVGSTKIGQGKNLQYLLEDAGVYTFMLIFGNGFGCKDTSYQDVIVSGPKAAFDIEPLNDCLPYQVLFRDKSTYKSARKTIKWDFGNGLFSNRLVESTEYLPRDSLFTVSLFLEDVVGCRDTLTYEDTILTPNILVDFTVIDDSMCIGDAVDVNNISFGDNAQTFTWIYGDGGTSTLRNPPAHTYLSEKEFELSLKMNDVTGCEITTTKIISVQDKPIVGFTADVLSANCFPQRINFLDTSKSDFLAEWEWTFGDGGTSLFQNPAKNYNQRGEFDVSLIARTSNGCTDSLTKTTYIKIDGPDARFTISKDTICKFEDVTFEIFDPVGVNSFSWIYGDGNTGVGSPATHQYKTKTGTIRPVLLLTSGVNNSCIRGVTGDSIFVQEVVADFQIEGDTAGCEPHQVKLTNTSLNADSWGWDFGDGNLSTNYNDSNTYIEDRTYIITMNIESDKGCVDTAYQEIVVLEVPEIVTSTDTTICEGDATILKASGGDNYSWRPINGLLTPNSNQTVANPVESTAYTIEVEIVHSGKVCIDSSIVQLDVQAKPEDYTLISDTNLIIGEELQLDVNTGPTYFYNWTPAKWMNCYNCATPIAQPLESIIYYVDITDLFGCFPQRDSIKIDVTVDFTLEMPKAFSPNGDGVNDRIYVRGWGIKELLDFKIYNRFGEVVYESNKLEEGWDGEFRGQVQNVETYIYTISILTYHDKILTKKGNISLMR